jgi:hypothetical protein
MYSAQITFVRLDYGAQIAKSSQAESKYFREPMQIIARGNFPASSQLPEKPSLQRRLRHQRPINIEKCRAHPLRLCLQ